MTVLRPPVPADAPAVLAVLVARDVADIGEADYTLEDLCEDWSAREFELAADACVAEADDGSIVAYAAVTRTGTEAVVAPDYEGAGIGRRLLEWAEQRDRERGRQRHRQWVAGNHARGRALFLAAGYRPERSYWRMVRRLDPPPEETPPPAGVILRPPAPRHDDQTVHTLHQTSFSMNSDFRPQSLADFVEEHLRAHDLDPQLCLLAERRERPVGFLLARRWQEANVGFVALLGVVPDERHCGLGRAMLNAAFNRFTAAGLHEAQLGVASDNPNAVSLYQQCGMTAKFRFDTYQRPIAPGRLRREDVGTAG